MSAGLALSEDAVFADFADRVPLSGADVVEIGGAVPVEVTAAHGVASWRAVDPNREALVDGHYAVVRARAEDLPLPDESADAVFSSNAFQFLDVSATLAQVARVLRPGGVLHAHFGPIWSAVDGHQLEYTRYDGRDLLFWRDTLLPPWAHLAYTREELVALLSSAVAPDLVEVLVRHVHDSTTVNRMFFEDYVAAALGSGLRWERVEASSVLDYAIEPPAYDSALLREVDEAALSAHWSARRGSPTSVGYRDVLMVLRKPERDGESRAHS
ncbi:class I SAM-dependent methyltransferase [Actinokineospora auranticolor]|uniref:Methyltransferase family protein n=1 Tax=Actinokineospora auranticolor TaxID=155976 RepID=A0A2S6GIG5_9PSEU|nr:class I SAM-dependent methyltransferase [Actinokineospora auranticolor]PPK65005.1 methyltransferase family protein [Actinokineospora auranticolor]